MAKRRSRYQVNPLTGRKERIPGTGEFRNPLTGRIEKAPQGLFGVNTPSKPTRKARSRQVRRPRRLTKKELEDNARAGLLAVGVMVVVFVLYWVQQHPIQATVIAVMVIGGAAFSLWKIPSLRRKVLGRHFGLFEGRDAKDQELAVLISEIKRMNVQEVRDEEDFEKQLYQRLEAKGYHVKRQVSRQGRRIDLVVNGHIAVELKIADRSKNVQDLIGQVTVYKKFYDTILVGILDDGRVSDMDEYIELICGVSPGSIHVVVLDGDIRRRKTKKRYIKVEERTDYA